MFRFAWQVYSTLLVSARAAVRSEKETIGKPTEFFFEVF
jgi:hypothetical protein